MERFYLERPSIDRKAEAIEYINEFIENNSEIHGVGSLHKYLENYESWLKHLQNMRDIKEIDKLVPAETFFLIRENDNKIVGMIDIRLALNDFLKKYGGNIGYSIRPTERRKGYNKINLYLALKFCKEKGLSEVLLDCDYDNLGSASSIISLGGKLVKEGINEISNTVMKDFVINVDESLNKYSSLYGVDSLRIPSYTHLPGYARGNVCILQLSVAK
jgi:predicted acetyltransferase